MKYSNWFTILLMLVAFTVPAAAKPTGDGVGRGELLRGKVLSVRDGQATLVLYVKVDSPDAPGKIPDEMASHAASQEGLANQFERQGKTEQAKKCRDLAYQLRCWREVEGVIGKDTPLVGISSSPCSQVALGTRLVLDVSAAGKPETVPAHVSLQRAAKPVGPRMPSTVIKLPGGPRDDKTFFTVIGEVVSADPLTVAVNGMRITIDNPRDYPCWQLRKLSLRDLSVDQRIFARARINGDLSVSRIIRVIVSDSDTTIDFDDDMAE